MNPFPSIDPLFKDGKYSKPEFEFLEDKPWVWTEKIKGTPVRIKYHTDEGKFLRYINIFGKTDDMTVSDELMSHLGEVIDFQKILDMFDRKDVCFYGEGYGAGIKKDGVLYGPKQKFIVHNIKVGDLWLPRNKVEEITDELGFDVVPIVVTHISPSAISHLSVRKSSMFPKVTVTEVVGQPLIQFLLPHGERVIAQTTLAQHT